MKKIITFILIFFLFIIEVNAIENISINNYDLVPRFDKSTKVYNVFVNSTAEIVTINAIESKNEIITGNGSKSLKKGINKFEINSYLDNKLLNSYIIFITRGEELPLEDDAHLESVLINNKDINFESDKFIYYISDNILDIDYTSKNPNSFVSLKTTNEEVTIKVVSENKENTNTYKFLINKSLNIKSPNKNISSTKLDEVDLKVIRILIITFILIVLSIIFYFMFIKKRSNKDLYI